MTEERGNAEGKEELAAAVGVEGQSAADGSQVCGRSRVVTDQVGTGRMRQGRESPVELKVGGAKAEPTGQQAEMKQGDQRPEA